MDTVFWNETLHFSFCFNPRSVSLQISVGRHTA